MSVEIFIPAKGVSDRIAKKNMRPIGSRSLVANAVRIAQRAFPQAQITVDSESEEILGQFEATSRVRCLKRPEEMATNETDGNALMLYAANNSEAEILVQLLPTAPFLFPETVRRAVAAIGEKYDSAFTVARENKYVWDAAGPRYDLRRIPNSNDVKPITSETMGLYVIRRSAALALRRRIGESPKMIEVEPVEQIDVNNLQDLRLAQLVATALRNEEQCQFRALAQIISTPLLLDVAREEGLENAVFLVDDMVQQSGTETVVGRASTLTLRFLRNDESADDIYRALETYDYVSPGDIIVVENSESNAAYFGDINATIAVRRGAIAACILGKTRDAGAVAQMSFPVFSRGITPVDVKGRATLHAARTPIKTDGGVIEQGDLIVGDTDGVVVVKQVHEEALLSFAIEASMRESQIRHHLAVENLNLQQIIAKFGTF